MGDNHSELLFKVKMESKLIQFSVLVHNSSLHVTETKNFDVRLNYDCFGARNLNYQGKI